jgi:hypothetical protein
MMVERYNKDQSYECLANLAEILTATKDSMM